MRDQLKYGIVSGNTVDYQLSNEFEVSIFTENTNLL